MQRHANVQAIDRAPILAREFTLRIDCRGNCIRRTPERRAKRIADRLEHVTAVPFDHAAQQFVVTAQRLCHRVAPLFPTPRASLDIGEEQRYRPRRNWSRQRHS